MQRVREVAYEPTIERRAPVRSELGKIQCHLPHQTWDRHCKPFVHEPQPRLEVLVNLRHYVRRKLTPGSTVVSRQQTEELAAKRR
jgi:hypothetical protein